MDFSLSEEQQFLLESLDEILDQYASPAYMTETDHEHRQPVEFKWAMQETGLLFLGVPEEYGDTPVDVVTMRLIGERVASYGLNLGYAAEILQVPNILEFGSPEQCESVLGISQDDGIPSALAFTESRAGPDSSVMKTTAEHRDGRVRFNGTRTLITNAVDTRYLLTVAIDPDTGDPRRVISMHLVPIDTSGIEIPPISKMCWYIADLSETYYNDVEVNGSYLVGVKGKDFKQLVKNFELERIMTVTQSLGLAETAFKDIAEYAATRVQFGKPIGLFQLVQEELMDMTIRTGNMESFIYHSASMADDGTLDRKQAAVCKRYCSMAAFEVCDDALQIHGGIGVTEGVRIKWLWRDAYGRRFGGGIDEIMVHVIGRQIAKEHTK